MKERPILFSAPMVRALLDGSKTQTRRIVKNRKEPDIGCDMSPGEIALEPIEIQQRMCPYGQPGDRLWVRETHLNWWTINPESPQGPRVFSHVAAFAADGYQLEPGEKWIPSIHMLRAASRILLEIVSVRVERLNDISAVDAVAEGIAPFTDFAPTGHWKRYVDGGCNAYVDSPIASYASLWTEINGSGSWEANPWVWVIEFRRVTP